MITSADLLDLHISALEDYLRTGVGGYHSRKTDTLIKKVVNGLLWSLNIEGERETDRYGGFGFLHWRDKLLQAKDSKEKMILINSCYAD